MINPNDRKLTISRQAELMTVNRTSVYRKEPTYTESQENIVLMHRIDEIHTVKELFEFLRWSFRMILWPSWEALLKNFLGEGPKLRLDSG